MKRLSAWAFILSALVSIANGQVNNLRLQFTTPGIIGNSHVEFVNALPVGNGRLGASIYGQPENEVVTINADSIWSGGPEDRINPLASQSISSVQAALLIDDVSTAAKIAYANLTANPTTNRAYQFLADLNITFPGHDTYTNYERFLDLQNATIQVSYDVGTNTFNKKWIASYPHNIILGHIVSAESNELNFNASWSRTGLTDGTRNGSIIAHDNGTLVLKAAVLGDGAPTYASILSITSVDGSITVSNETIAVANATEALIAISCDTDYWYPNSTAQDLETMALETTSTALSLGFDAVENYHITDFRNFFDRVTFELSSPGNVNTSTSLTARYQNFKNGVADLGLMTMLYQFGRYAMISSSREGSLPPNLLGIWNNENDPLWGGKFTTDLNVQMNHWMVEIVGLSEFHLQLFDFTQQRVMPNGMITAREMYNCSGWVSHSNNDLWGDTAPHDKGTAYTFWPSGGAWPMTHLFEHYRFTGNTNFLEEQALPILTGLVEFFNDFLIEKDGYLVTAPSASTENKYITPSGVTEAIAIGPEEDNEILTEIYRNFIDASNILGSTYLISEANDTLSRIRAPQESYFGGIQQWEEDWEEASEHDGMMSTLLALYPFSQINYWESPPEYLEWANTSLYHYLNESIGGCSWCTSWTVAHAARLRNAELAYNHLEILLNEHVSTTGAIWTMNQGWQIDGNFGVTAAISEMLLQSHGPRNGPYPIFLLPAIPNEWPTGSVTGLGARGGFTVNISWQNGTFVNATITSTFGTYANITVGNLNGLEVKLGAQESVNGNIGFKTKPGTSYVLQAS